MGQSGNLIAVIRSVMPKQKENIYIGRIISISEEGKILLEVAGIQVDEENIYIASYLYEKSTNNDINKAFLLKDGNLVAVAAINDNQTFIILSKVVSL